MRESEVLDGVAAAVGIGGCALTGCPWAVAGTSPFAKATYAIGGTTLGVQSLPDDIANGPLPAIVVVDAGLPDIGSGSYEVSKWDVEIGVWSEYSPRSERTRQLLNWREQLKQAMRAHARGGLIDPEVSSALLVSAGAIEMRQWRRAENAPPYLVLPLRAQITYRRAVAYAPA